MSSLKRLVARLLFRSPHVEPAHATVDDFTDTGDLELPGLSDMLGKAIQIFSRIAYPGAFERNKSQMVVGQVTEITDEGGLVVKVELRSREDNVTREFVRLKPSGVRNVVVLG